MKILYGVVGEGMGHAMRSRVILSHLVARGADVSIMASGRATDFLSKHFSGVNRIHGFHMIYEENRMRLGKTILSNVTQGLEGLPKNIRAYFELLGDFRPDVVISDFESWTYLYAKMHRLPIVSIDNMQIINRCTLPPEIYEGHETDFRLTKAFIKSKLPFCDDYFITSFFRPEIRKPNTRLFPPILRPEILNANRRKGDHLLVYQTSDAPSALLPTLARSGIECRLYGVRRDIKEEQVEGNLRFRPFSENGFIDDLASARAVVAGGGFTLMGEAVFLHKPMLAVPLGRQFEQILNARYLEREGFGRHAEALDNAQIITDFLANVPRYEEALTRYAQKDNGEILSALDGFLDRAMAGV